MFSEPRKFVCLLVLSVVAACTSNNWVAQLKDEVGTGSNLRVFVTSIVSLGDLSGFNNTSTPDTGACVNVSGIERGNCACQGLAQLAGLSDFERFRAWLRTDTISPACNVAGESNSNCSVSGSEFGPYVTVNGSPTIFERFDDFYLNHTPPLANIDINATGGTLTNAQKVWTGVDQQGGPTGNCTNWTAASGTGGAGIVSETSLWTFAAPEENCGSATLPIYCFEQPQ